jgi:hypothetical protein
MLMRSRWPDNYANHECASHRWWKPPRSCAESLHGPPRTSAQAERSAKGCCRGPEFRPPIAAHNKERAQLICCVLARFVRLRTDQKVRALAQWMLSAAHSPGDHALLGSELPPMSATFLARA